MSGVIYNYLRAPASLALLAHENLRAGYSSVSGLLFIRIFHKPIELQDIWIFDRFVGSQGSIIYQRILFVPGSYQPSNELMLRFYSYFKQASTGPCDIPKPGFWDVINR